MNASIKLLQEESLKIERLVGLKTTLLKLPVNILSGKEVYEIKKMFQEFTTRLERLFTTFQEGREQKLSQNKRMDDNDKQLEKQFEDIKKKDLSLKESIDYLTFEYDKIKEEEIKYLRRNKRNDLGEESSSYSGSERSEGGEQESLIINKIFLNSIVTTNDMHILKRKTTLEEERNYIMELFKINELFPSSISKQLILVDFYMNIYTFCIEQQFTLQQMSTIFSIFYFLFSYSFINANIVCEKSLALFAEILDFHSLNRPPFSYEIFNQHERDVIYNFGKMSFYRNYSLFENIFQYEVSICFFSKEPKAIPFRQLPSISHYELKSELRQGSENIPDIIKRMIEEREKEIEPEEENDEAENEIKDEKSEEEINEEKQMKKLRDFMNMFNQTNSLEQIKKEEEDEKIRQENELETNAARGFLESKISEMTKEITEKINISNKAVFNPVIEALNEKEKAKKGK